MMYARCGFNATAGVFLMLRKKIVVIFEKCDTMVTSMYSTIVIFRRSDIWQSISSILPAHRTTVQL